MSTPELTLHTWEEALRERRLRTWTGMGLAALLLAGSAAATQVGPYTLLGALPAALDYLAATGPDLADAGGVAGLQEWFWGWRRWLAALLDTVAIAFLATLLGVVVAAPLSFAAASNLTANGGLRFGARAVLQVARTVPDLVLALGVHSAGSLGKLLIAVNENIDQGPVAGVLAAGAGPLEKLRFAVLPQTLPALVSYALLRLEINVRSAAVVGFVGVGGIGQELYTAVRQFVYPDVGAILVLIVSTVVLVDAIGDRFRRRILGAEGL